MLDRRHFLTATTRVAARLTFRSPLLAQLEKAPAKLPDQSLLDKKEDSYWAERRQQFVIPADEIYLNVGTVGSSLAPVGKRPRAGPQSLQRCPSLLARTSSFLSQITTFSGVVLPAKELGTFARSKGILSATERHVEFFPPFAGDFTIDLTGVQVSYAFNRFLNMTTFVQADTAQTQAVSANFRIATPSVPTAVSM